jgi:hypothetical protein
LVECQNCGSNDLELVEVLEDERRRLRCLSCAHEWLRGEPKRVYKTTTTFQDLKGTFPSQDDVSAEALARASELAKAFRTTHVDMDPRVAAFRARYLDLFSQDALAHVTPDELKYFANSNLSGNPGTMTVFNNEWNRIGPNEAAYRVKDAIGYLLYGPENTYIEDRLTNLISIDKQRTMLGFREALLTKVLCMVEPDRFLPIFMYTGQAGKREIARSVYGLNLPAPEAVSWTIGRLIFWSNDLLMELAGSGFRDTAQVAGFLWWAKDQVTTTGEAPSDK